MFLHSRYQFDQQVDIYCQPDSGRLATRLSYLPLDSATYPLLDSISYPPGCLHLHHVHVVSFLHRSIYTRVRSTFIVAGSFPRVLSPPAVRLGISFSGADRVIIGPLCKVYLPHSLLAKSFYVITITQNFTTSNHTVMSIGSPCTNCKKRRTCVKIDL